MVDIVNLDLCININWHVFLITSAGNLLYILSSVSSLPTLYSNFLCYVDFSGFDLIWYVNDSFFCWQVKDICNELEVRSLCHKILQNVSTLLHADRGSLFLVQGERGGGCSPQVNGGINHVSRSRCLVSIMTCSIGKFSAKLNMLIEN